MTMNRRMLLAMLAAAPLVSMAGGAIRAAEGPCGKGTLTEDGLHTQPWFVQGSFLDLAEELAEAKKEGRHFVVLVEQKGCPYCKEMHEKYFTQKDICELVRDNFRVLQIDLRGAREVTDFDGSTMTEKEWARKHLKLGFTPSLLFFAGDAAEIGRKPPRQRAVAVMEGLYNPYDFRILFKYVKEEAFKTKKWPDYRREQWSRKG